MCSRVGNFVYYILFEYDTPKIVHIRSITVGLINRFIQLVILGYIIGYVIIYNKGYQEFSTLQSSVTSKVKGAVYTGDASQFLEHGLAQPEFYKRIWDVADYIVPSQENGAFFVMTNAIITPNQTQGRNATFPVVNETICAGTNLTVKCTEGKTTAGENGVMTGKCVKYNDTVSTCEAFAWFPLEVDKLVEPYDKEPLLNGTENFTVLIKNSILFSTWPYLKTRNIIKVTNNSSYLKSCLYDDDRNPFCPIFRLGTIVEDAGENYTDIATQGGVIGIFINWDCNLDFDINKCTPKYKFRRLDDPDVAIAPGWNFRFAHFYSDTERTLYKAYGILFVVIVEGRGGKFNVVPLMLNVGSGLALLSIAVVICDIIVLYFMKRKDHYRESKFQVVQDVDSAGLIENDELERANYNTAGSQPYNY